MPRATLKTGIVDSVLAPGDIPAALLKRAARLSPVGGEALVLSTDALEPQGALEQIFELLRNAYGIDFGHYKPNTVARRLERRLTMVDAADLDEYVARLRVSPAELDALYHDLLIGS
jgi:two-component system, chemotaxis family, CheB/CheR fusion protein